MSSRSSRTFLPSAAESESDQTSEPLLFSGNDDPRFELQDLERGRTRDKSSPIARPAQVKSAGALPRRVVSRHVWARTLGWRIQKAIAGVLGGRNLKRHSEPEVEGQPTHRSHRGRRRKLLHWILKLLAGLLMLLGLIQLIVLGLGILEAFFPDDLEWVADRAWPEESGRIEGDLLHWPTDFTADIKPVACHSHNDYWRKEPLYTAIGVGCSGVEADIWLFEDELYVGHSVASLTANRTLKSLYINPILEILDKQNPLNNFHTRVDSPPNGIFDTDPSQALVLLIDFKTDGEAIWPVLESQLEPLRAKNYLTHYDGTLRIERPVTVVATGNAPFDLLTSNPNYRDIFFDAPLDQMSSVDTIESSSPFAAVLSGPATSATNSTSISSSFASSLPGADEQNRGQGHSGNAPTTPLAYNPQNSYYASVSFSKSIGHPWRSRLSHSQISLLRAQIRGAHSRGLKVRYWSVPSWPRGLRNYIWRVLIREGVDVLNVDDLKYAVRGDWGPRKGGWGGKWWW